MNIEEADLAVALRETADLLGHVHLADSNRRPAGNGHTDFRSIADALRGIRYDGYLSAECLPWPDPDAAAAQTMLAFKQYFA
jgi:sugar phosphate isomerase/epimerase